MNRNGLTESSVERSPISTANAREAVASHFATLPMSVLFRLQLVSRYPLERTVMHSVSEPSLLLLTFLSPN